MTGVHRRLRTDMVEERLLQGLLREAELREAAATLRISIHTAPGRCSQIQLLVLAARRGRHSLALNNVSADAHTYSSTA
jgi:hypothetical protein